MTNAVKMADFTLEPWKDEQRVVLHGEWRPEIATYMVQHGIKGLHLNYALGFKGKELSFLNDVRHLEHLKIIHWTIDDVSPIHILHGLRSLEVSTYCKTEIDFSQFPVLEECFLEWRPKAKSLFKCLALKQLFINSYSGRETSPFSELVNLERLSIANSPVMSLDGIASLGKVKFLGLYNLRKLKSLHGLENLHNVEELEVNGCWALRSISELQFLRKLRKLQLCDDHDIESLKPISLLQRLESVLFYGTTVIVDGDLSPLTKLAHLRKLSFQDRPHYSHSLAELEAIGKPLPDTEGAR